MILQPDSPGIRTRDDHDSGSADDAPASSIDQASPDGFTPNKAPSLPRCYGNYELLEEIARGAMGVVYKARQLEPKRLVALKMLPGGEFATPAIVERFQVTARAAAALDHQGIVPIYEIGTIDSQPFLTMPLVTGGNLQQWVARLQPNLPSPDAVSRIVIRLCEAVQYAHERQPEIIHRDLKPQNILLAVGEGFDQVVAAKADDSLDLPAGNRDEFHPRLTDFGLARIADRDSGLTANGERVGTPGYMSPEQAAGDLGRIGRRTDVYGLGAVLYFLLTGRPPFLSASTEETMRQVREEEPLPPRRLNSSVPKDLETICLKCLAKRPEGRYRSARALADDLRRFLNGESIHARPAGVFSRGWRWARRHPGRAGVAAAAIVAAAGLFLWQQAEHRLQRHRQQAELDRVREHEEARRDAEALKQISTEAGLARGQLATGRFDEALAALDRVIPLVAADARHEDVAAELQSLRGEAQKLKDFYRLAERAWFRSSDDDRSGRRAIAESRRALQSVGVLGPDGEFREGNWWHAADRFSLDEAERERLVEEVYAQIVLVALLHMREGLTPLGSQFVAEARPLDRSGLALFELGLAFIARARAWERANGQILRTTRLMELVCYSVLGRAGGYPASEPRPEKPAAHISRPFDYFLDGLLHYYLGQTPDLPLIQLIKFFLSGENIDVANPLKRAEESLRVAARLQPDRFLPHFILGWTLMAEKDFAGAELAFNACVRLRPDEARGYLWRGLAMVERGVRLKDAAAGRELIDAGLGDRQKAESLGGVAPGHLWKSAEIFFTAGRSAEGLEACALALEAEDGLLLRRVTHRFDLRRMDDFVTKVIQADPANADAHAVQAMLWLRIEPSSAAKAAVESLRITPDHPRALTVRGLVALTGGNDPKAALADFQSAAAKSPGRYQPAAGLALAHEAAGDRDKALECYRLLCSAEGAARASADWQLVETNMALWRLLTAAGNLVEAEAARQKAYDIDAGAALYLERNPPFRTEAEK